MDELILLTLLTGLQTPVLDHFFTTIQLFGDMFVIVGIAFCLWIFGRKKVAYILSFGLILTGVIVQGLKFLISRPRPFGGPLDAFPSGHAAVAFLAATILGNHFRKIRVPLFILSSLTAFARLYFLVHYPSDVIAGAAIGWLIAELVLRYEEQEISLIQRIRKRSFISSKT
jgi:undecaprenyl-diphosphatase